MGPSKEKFKNKTAGNSLKDDVAKKTPTSEDTKDKDEPVELSEEDKHLQEELNLLVAKLMQTDVALYRPALESLRDVIMASTTSMTSVPKPLKFLRPHYDALKRVYKMIADEAVKKMCADVISVLAMAVCDSRDCLKYRLLGTNCAIGDWGHEYVRHVAGQVSAEWGEVSSSRLLDLALQIVPYNMAHNAEEEACDLLMEIEHIELLEQFVDESAFQRVCLYLTRCVPYVADPDNTTLLLTAMNILRRFNQHAIALRIAMQLNNVQLIREIFTTCKSLSLQKQLAFMLGRQQIFLELDSHTLVQHNELEDIMSNTHLNSYFLSLAREFDILEPKTPEDVYKSHLVHSRQTFGTGKVDSARQNLAASFVNGFVNCGFGRDKLLLEDGNKWLYKNKEHGMLSAMASLGLVLLWDLDGGLSPIDKYLYSHEEYIKSGALLACGLVNCGARNECDPAAALLAEYLVHPSKILKIGAVVGLGVAYAGSNKSEVLALLSPVFSDSSMEVVGMAALASGMIAVGSCNPNVTSSIVQILIERSEADLQDTFSRFLPLGLGLCHLGKQDSVEVILVALDVIAEPFRSMTKTLVEVCAYAGTGNVLKVQEMLHILSDHYEPAQKEDKKKNVKKDSKEKIEKKVEAEIDLSSTQAIAVLGIALISMGEDIGVDMALRSFGNLVRYCEPAIRRAVPLALGLVSVSNPRMNILDMLGKFSHDSDAQVSHSAIFAMGLVGAGSNNARLAVMLRQLAQFHAKDPNNLFMVRIAQGLTHLGKGMLTLSPFHSDRQLLSHVALSGILATLVAFLDVKNIILDKAHYLLFTLATAMQPRMLVTLDEDLNRVAVPVRVGMAVDVVGQAGTPKTITGFQTHKTPVLLGFGERAELATEEYTPLTPIMEGFVILHKNSGV